MVTFLTILGIILLFGLTVAVVTAWIMEDF